MTNKLRQALAALGVAATALLAGLSVGMQYGWDRGYKLGHSQGYKVGYDYSYKVSSGEKASTWAKREMKKHCPAWFDDRRKTKMVACFRPEWLKD